MSSKLRTHDVFNQPPPLGDVDFYAADPALREAIAREGGAFADDELAAFGARAGTEELAHQAALANEHPPRLRAFDRFGHRVDEVEYHPAYHRLMALGIEAGAHAMSWQSERPGAHVARAGVFYMLAQVEAGVCCPITMTHAAVPALRAEPELAAIWEPRIAPRTYDPRFLPPDAKRAVTFGMAMTEKQGGSDVRANTTRAVATADGGYLLTGHKWFCSAPMSDAFLTLAQLDGELTCFLVPRWRPDGTRNPFAIQRLKDKLGNRSNASSEVEYEDTWAARVGAPGRGVPTIIQMVMMTRIDCALGVAGGMRMAVRQASHHARHRRAFGALLIDQPLMRNVLADLALEAEAAVALAMRVARAADDAPRDRAAALLSRVVTPIAKYWICKRSPHHAAEALECLGGAGYVEESMMPRIYREAPLNSIWEGSGNVQCLDVLRALRRSPEALSALRAELAAARGGDRRLDAHVDALTAALANVEQVELRARRLVEGLALALQGALLVRHAPAAVADAFCASRLARDAGLEYGTLPAGLDLAPILERAT